MAKRPRSLGSATPLEQAFTVVVASLREGEVISYGDVADRAGRPHAARAAGSFLAQATADLPWWRVVRACGELAAKDVALQTELLEAERVKIQRGRVVRAPRGRFARRAP